MSDDAAPWASIDQSMKQIAMSLLALAGAATVAINSDGHVVLEPIVAPTPTMDPPPASQGVTWILPRDFNRTEDFLGWVWPLPDKTGYVLAWHNASGLGMEVRYLSGKRYAVKLTEIGDDGQPKEEANDAD